MPPGAAPRSPPPRAPPKPRPAPRRAAQGCGGQRHPRAAAPPRPPVRGSLTAHQPRRRQQPQHQLPEAHCGEGGKATARAAAAAARFSRRRPPGAAEDLWRLGPFLRPAGAEPASLRLPRPRPGGGCCSRGDAAPSGSAGKEARAGSPLPAGQPSPARWHLPKRQRRASRPPPGACPSPLPAAVPPRARSSPGGTRGAGRDGPALPCRGAPSWEQRRALAGTWLRAGCGEAGGGNVVSVRAWWVRPQWRCEASGAGVGWCVQVQEKQLWLRCVGPSAWQTHAWVKGCQSARLV